MSSVGKLVHIPAGTATTVVSTVPCTLIGIAFNTKGASSNVATVYDNTAGSGSVIAVIDTTDKIGTIDYGGMTKVGLTIVSATGTGADMTVSLT
jgi:hypothetical protein